jgi:hypothetical protein
LQKINKKGKIMKIKTAAILTLSVISLNAFAFHGENFKVVSEKLTQSPGFNGGIVSKDDKENKTFSATAKAWTYNSSGKPMEYIKIAGDHDANFLNDTDKTMRYTYTYILSSESAYQNFERTIDLYPQGHFSDSSRSYGTVQKEKEGIYPINASTRVSGADSAYHEAHATLKINK